jgi:hypothetical protein
MATNIVSKGGLGGGQFVILGRSISGSSEGEVSLRVEYACIAPFTGANYGQFKLNDIAASGEPDPQLSVLSGLGNIGPVSVTNIATKTERGITYVTVTYSAPLVDWFTTTTATSERTFFKSVEALDEDESRIVSTLTFDYTATTVTTTSKFEMPEGSGEIPPSPPRNIRVTGQGGITNPGVKFVTNKSVTRGSSGLYVYQSSVTGIYEA